MDASCAVVHASFKALAIGWIDKSALPRKHRIATALARTVSKHSKPWDGIGRHVKQNDKNSPNAECGRPSSRCPAPVSRRIKSRENNTGSKHHTRKNKNRMNSRAAMFHVRAARCRCVCMRPIDMTECVKQAPCQQQPPHKPQYRDRQPLHRTSQNRICLDFPRSEYMLSLRPRSHDNGL